MEERVSVRSLQRLPPALSLLLARGWALLWRMSSVCGGWPLERCRAELSGHEVGEHSRSRLETIAVELWETLVIKPWNEMQCAVHEVIKGNTVLEFCLFHLQEFINDFARFVGAPYVGTIK